MKTIEISDELYDKIMHEESKDGMPFEPTIWKLLKDRNDFNKMNKQMLTMVMGAAMHIPKHELDKKMRMINNED